MTHRVLIVEDDCDIAHLVELHLRDLGCETVTAHDGASGLRRAESEPFDLVILDLMLPDLDGLEICRRLRAAERYVPILMLTARGTELDRVLGLEMGADDYLTKPFSVLELLARVKALFRRVEAIERAGREVNGARLVEIEDLRIDDVKRRVTVGDREIRLTAKEYDLLLFFALHPGRVFTRAQLLDHVWGYGHSGYEHTVNSHINRLRAKIEAEPSAPRFILTVWGVGYRFTDSHERATG